MKKNAVNSFISQLQLEGLVIAVDEKSSSSLLPQNWKEQITAREIKAVFNAPVLSKYTDMQDLLILDLSMKWMPQGGPQSNLQNDRPAAAILHCMNMLNSENLI